MALEVRLAETSALSADVSVVALPVLAGDDGPALLGGEATVPGRELPDRLDTAWCERQGFTAKLGQSATLEASPGAAKVVLVGLGKADGVGPERWRRLAAAVVKLAGRESSAALVLPVPLVDPVAVGAALTEGAVLASYRFGVYQGAVAPPALEQLLLVGPAGDDGALREGIRKGTVTADAVSFARDLVNTAPSDLTPTLLAERVVARLDGLAHTSVEVWDEPRIEAERLGGLLGVARGSSEPPRLIWGEYAPPGAEGRAHVVIVGKGITFDSGGLSLKTADGMTTMKTDMSGAAAVLSALSACAALEVPVRVTAIAPCTENMPGSRAIKPGDVLTARNGATIEVLNTDAEGRLVLADGLSLAVELQPDAIIDLATLTGAAVVALGRSIACLFSSDDELATRVRAASDRAGEPLWPMPLPEEYADHIDSEIADMKNTGAAGQAGSIAAAMLLARFTGSVPWVHLDIAGPARSAENSGYLTKGGTGFGVRTLLEVLGSYGTD
jgi:leucyl aminopeptidase